MEDFPSFTEIDLGSFRSPMSSAQVSINISGGPIKIINWIF